MDSLLRWSIENSSPSTGPVQPREDLDPAIIDHILGKPDAVLMKEALSVAVDEKKSEDERVEALDNLEMVSSAIELCVYEVYAKAVLFGSLSSISIMLMVRIMMFGVSSRKT